MFDILPINLMNEITQIDSILDLSHLNVPAIDQWHQYYDAILITGPTASGKSALSMYLANFQLSSIISIDSALIYKGMDIGTAKPSLIDRNLVPHYLLDIIEPNQTYSVAQFLLDTQAAIIDCQMQNRLPILVGGTMMYVNALYHGLSELPAIDDRQRNVLVARANIQGWATLHAELMKLDPITAVRISPNDAQRIERALAVVYSTGIPLSTWIANKPSNMPLIVNRVHSQGHSTPHLLNRCLHISIEPEKKTIWQYIEQRFDAMLKHGFLEEVTALMQRTDLSSNLPSMRCIGYRQAWQYIESNQRSPLSYSLSDLRENTVIATRQLAKRQMTWLRRMPQRKVINTPLLFNKGTI